MLSHYGRQASDITLLREGDNRVFRVHVPEEGSYILRLHTSGRHTPEALTSELEWLNVLAHGTPLRVPQPVRSVFNSLVVPVAFEASLSVLCTLFTWLEGESLPEGEEFTLEQAANVGQILARLHVEAERFQAPVHFERPEYNSAYFLSCGEEFKQNLASSVDPRRLDLLNDCLVQLLQGLGPLEEAAGGFGIVHADVHPGNFLQHNNELALIDFDRCGWGPLLLDLAHADLAMDVRARAALMSGYTRIRPLPADYEQSLKALRVLAAIENLTVLSRRPHELPFVLEAMPTVEQALCGLIRS
nr:phosphotransferase [Deinococcus humi]